MTIREFIEGKQPHQTTTDYVDICNNTSSMQRQRKYEHGLLYSSYSCQLSMDVNPSIAIINRSWNDGLNADSNYTQFKGNQQQQQRNENCTEESVSSLYCGTHERYSSSLNYTTSPPNNLSHSNAVVPSK